VLGNLLYGIPELNYYQYINKSCEDSNLLMIIIRIRKFIILITTIIIFPFSAFRFLILFKRNLKNLVTEKDRKVVYTDVRSYPCR
jgi:hypothetical protein